VTHRATCLTPAGDPLALRAAPLHRARRNDGHGAPLWPPLGRRDVSRNAAAGHVDARRGGRGAHARDRSVARFHGAQFLFILGPGV